MSLKLDRRRFLAAGGATALTLPFLRALPSYAGGDKRYLILLFSSCGVVRHLWGADPGAAPGSFTLRPWLQPLAKYQSQMVVVRGLCNKSAGIGDPHGPGMATLWTGADATGQTPAMSPSIDQVIATSLAAPTPHATLEFRAKSPQDYQGKSIYNRMIYDAMGQQVDPREDPIAARDELFLGIGADAGADAGPDPKVALRKAVIGHVDGELGRLTPQLCNEDRTQVQALRDGLDTLNKNVGTTGMGPLQGCTYPTAVTGDPAFPKATRDHIELLVMSLACDLTRVASLQFSQALSPMVPDWLGITLDHHNISHEAPHRFQLGPNAPVTSDADHPTPSQVANMPALDQLTTINQFYAGEVAYLCDRLGQFPVGNGKTLLDQTLIVWGNELDNGSDHDHWELPFVILGGGGAIKTSQLVTYPIFNGYGQPEDAKYMAKRAHNDLHVTLAKLMGVNLSTFGNPSYNTGPLTEIIA